MLIVSKNKTQSYDTIERKKENKYHITFGASINILAL